MGIFREFPYSNFHEMNMDEIIKIIKNMLEEWAQYHAEWDQWMADLEASWTEYQDDVNAQWAAYQNTMNTAWQSMQDFINNYFDNLDLQEEVNNKIVSMLQTGEFGLLINEYVPPAVNAWMNLHITEPEGVIIDTSLTVAGACADAKATGDAIDEIDSVFDKTSVFYYTDNILPPYSESGYWDPNTGEAVENATRIRCVNYIPVNPDVQLHIRIKNNAWGGSKITIIQFDSNDDVIRNDTKQSDDYVYIRSNCVKIKMYVDNITPILSDICFRYTLGEYVAYEETEVVTRTLKDSTLPADVSKIKDAISYHTSANLFDKNTITAGSYINASDGSERSASTLCCAYIPISESGTYTTMVVRSYFGSANAAKVWLYDSELAPIKYVTGTLADEAVDVTENTFTISEEDIATAKYAGVTYRLIDIDEMMFVKGSYPTSYIMYENYSLFNGLNIEETNVQNHLYKNVIAFDGDSICNASSETSETWHRGWAYRVGDNNHMLWHNYGVGGGTITNGLTFGGNPTYCISENFEEIIDQNPELDYFIFDGGTNDADIIADDSAIGSIDYTNFSGPYDDTTFVGAFEKLIYTALNNYPNLKIGYIVAPKMGLQTNFKTCRRYTFFKLAMEICEKWGVPYINLWDESPLNPKIPSMYDSSLTNAENIERGSLYVDGQHLTKEGYDAISNAIDTFVKSL